MSGYIGTQPVPQATQTRDSFTATSGQTSFATGGYTPNFLDVYLNGVKLASADYTATNGSDVVLASGASTGDILEVVAFTTFNSASSSIDDNGNATAMTIDSSENVLVGTTSMTASDTSGTGMMYANGVALRVKRESSGGGQPCLDLNNTGSDDVMAMFRKDGVTVGSIGNDGSDTIFIGSGNVAVAFQDGANAVTPWNTAGGVSDNVMDLGRSLSRFKDLYLSGGVYLGGTGAANKLEDYEEGTWTPVYSDSAGNAVTNLANQNGRYVKVGNLVYIGGDLRTTGSSSISGLSGTLFISGLPFTQASTEASGRVTFHTHESSVSYNAPNELPRSSPVVGNTSRISIYKYSGSGGRTTPFLVSDLNMSGNSNFMFFSGTYEAS